MPRWARVVLLLVALYAFITSISLLGESFKFLGEDFARQLLSTTSNPLAGLCIGILATSIIQSSSTVTSITVALVAAGGLSVSHAIPLVLGANLGTSVTNALVAAGQIARPVEFRRAFAVAVVDDFFEILSLLLLFPLHLATNFLDLWAGFLAGTFADVGGLTWGSPLHMVVTPIVDGITSLVSESGVLMLVIALILLILALHNLVVSLKVLLIGRVEAFIDNTLFRTAARAMALGFVLTVVLQSSSVTTSLAVPLAGIGLLSLAQVFPFALGANVGTTTTALMAALVTGQEAALTVAFVHLLYNLVGIAIVWPIRRLPLYLAETLAAWTLKSRLVPLFYVAGVFFAVPIIVIYFVG